MNSLNSPDKSHVASIIKFSFLRELQLKFPSLLETIIPSNLLTIPGYGKQQSTKWQSDTCLSFDLWEGMTTGRRGCKASQSSAFCLTMLLTLIFMFCFCVFLVFLFFCCHFPLYFVFYLGVCSAQTHLNVEATPRLARPTRRALGKIQRNIYVQRRESTPGDC